MITLDVDVVTETGVRQAVARYGGRIVRYRRVGPGGGNPNFWVEFAEQYSAREFISTVYGEWISEDDFQALVVRTDALQTLENAQRMYTREIERLPGENEFVVVYFILLVGAVTLLLFAPWGK